jgi:chemotaxis protein MotB
MAGHRRKRGGHGERAHENHERWLLTYADMITLLVAFFIMLYAMSVLNQEKFEQLAISIRSGFGGSMMNGTPTIIKSGGGVNGMPAITTSSQAVTELPKEGTFPQQVKQVADTHDARRLDKAFEILRAYIKKHDLERFMRVVRDERGVVVTVMTDKMLFARGQADLRPEELGLLNELSGVLNTVPNQVRVEGHTDDLPIHTVRFPSNWELSVTRATTVLRYFEQRGVSPHRLEAAGYAGERPLAPNDSERDRALNRRVDVVILRRN